MKIIKNLFIGALVCTFLLVSIGAAQTTPSMQGATLVASVNISKATIDTSVENAFAISFELSNGEDVQDDVRYSVQLMQKMSRGYVLVDRHTYEESLSLNEHTSVQRTIIYTAPEMLAGKYTLLLSAANSSGFPYGTASLGEVDLIPVKKGVEITPGGCTVSTTNVTCSVVSHIAGLVAVTPSLQVSSLSTNGALQEESPSTLPSTVLKAGEKKSLVIPMPKITTPGVYTIAITLLFNNTESNTITLPYTISGEYASIVTTSLDADYYAKGDTATVLLLWAGNRAVSAEVEMHSKKGALCGKTAIPDVKKGKESILVSIQKECMNPRLEVRITTNEGVTLDQKNMTIQTTSRPQPSLWSGGTGIALGVLILLVLIGTVTLLRKKKLSPPAVTLPIAILVAALALLLPSSVSASTYLMPVGSDVYATINLNGGSTATPPVYSNAPGTQIEVVGQLELSPFSSNTYTISLSAVTVGNTTIQLFNDPVILSPSNPLAIAFPKYLTAPQCDVANPCPRLEEITVTASVLDAGPGGGAIGNVFSIGPYYHGATALRKVVYTGQQIHPQLTVRVKSYGTLQPYAHTTDPIPPDNQDEIYIIPESTWSTPMPQLVSCSSNCGNPIAGYNYAVVHSVVGANVSTSIPVPFSVCRYSDAPSPGQYFSPAISSNLSATCQDNYPDAEVIR
jgi:hypothetical protein